MESTAAASLSLLLLLLVGGCGASAGSSDAAGAPDTDDAPAPPLVAYGAACVVDADCATGLCLASDHAPFPWCARPCDAAAVGGFCRQPDDEPPALCVEYPGAAGDPLGEGFRSRDDVRRFCAPLCVDDAACRALDPRFVCRAPEWRGNPLYPDTTDRVCRGETIGGYDPGKDPSDCAGWDRAPGRFPEAAFVCDAYCDYLGACRELPDTLSRDCCGRGCFQRMTAGDRLDTDYRNQLTCFVDYFGAFRDTALVCTEPLDRCGAPPIPTESASP